MKIIEYQCHNTKHPVKKHQTFREEKYEPGWLKTINEMEKNTTISKANQILSKEDINIT